MNRSSTRLTWRVQSRRQGATTVEHGLMIALIAAICIALITSLGSHLGSLFDVCFQETSPRLLARRRNGQS